MYTYFLLNNRMCHVNINVKTVQTVHCIALKIINNDIVESLWNACEKDDDDTDWYHCGGIVLLRSARLTGVSILIKFVPFHDRKSECSTHADPHPPTAHPTLGLDARDSDPASATLNTAFIPERWWNITLYQRCILLLGCDQ